MGDIVERLRTARNVWPHGPLMKEAADEIERLRRALYKAEKATDSYGPDEVPRP